LITGVFSDRLKSAIILPIHKKGDKLIMSNLLFTIILLKDTGNNTVQQIASICAYKQNLGSRAIRLQERK